MKNRDGLKNIAFSDSVVEDLIMDDGRVITVFCAPDKPVQVSEPERDYGWWDRIKRLFF